MIKILEITIQHAPLGRDPGVWVMDFLATKEDGKQFHGSWNSESIDGCLTGLPIVIERLNKQECYA